MTADELTAFLIDAATRLGGFALAAPAVYGIGGLTLRFAWWIMGGHTRTHGLPGMGPGESYILWNCLWGGIALLVVVGGVVTILNGVRDHLRTRAEQPHR